MPSKNVAISVRLDEDDAQFLEELDLEGVDTLSDKLRAIIEQARQREAGRHSFQAGLKMIDSLLDPVRLALIDQERREQAHSELMTRVYEWLPDMVAFVLASVDPEPGSQQQISLAELEGGVADRVFRLISATLRLGLSRNNPCYDPQAISRRLDDVLELARLLDATRPNAEEESR